MDWFTTCFSLVVISTSLNLVSYATEADLPFSLSISSQDVSQELQQSDDFGADFRQIMSSQASSQDSSAAQTYRQSSQSQGEAQTGDDTESSSADPTGETSAQSSLDKHRVLKPDSLLGGETGLSAVQIFLKGAALTGPLLPNQNDTSVDRASTTAANKIIAPASESNQQLRLQPAFARILPIVCGTQRPKSNPAKVNSARDVQKDLSEPASSLPLTDLPSSILLSEPNASALVTHAPNRIDLNVAGAALGQVSGASPAQVIGWNVRSVVPEAKNFAFAVRLEGASAQNGNTHPEESQSTANGVSISGAQLTIAGVAASGQSSDKPAGEGSGSHGGEHGEPLALGSDLIMNVGDDSAAQKTTGSSSSSVPDPAPALPSDTEAVSNTEPVRNVHLHLTGDNNQRVDIRMVEISGEMRVSVRAGDTKLAETLQDHIPDLAKGLNQQSIRAEIWTPRNESTASADNSNLGGQSSSRGGDDSNQSGQQRQGSSRQQQNKPDWVDELENSSSPITTKRSIQTWPQ